VLYIYSVCYVVPIKKQFTVAVIKPDAVTEGKVDEIIEKVVCVVGHLYHCIHTTIV